MFEGVLLGIRIRVWHQVVQRNVANLEHDLSIVLWLDMRQWPEGCD